MSIIRYAVSEQLAAQSPLARYKGSLLIIASGVAGILSQLALSPDLEATQWPAILTGIATITAFIVNRFTRDAVTPSMAARLEQAASTAYADQPSVTAPVEATPVGVLPIYTGPTTAAGEYEGRHREGATDAD